MRWIEVCIDTPGDEIDARCETLAALGAGGFVIENEEDFRRFLESNRQYWDYVDRELEDRFAGVSRIKTYLADDNDGRALLAAIRAHYPALSVSYVEDSDWENNWRAYYKPIEVGQRLLVVPEWEEAPPNGRLPLRLDPGLIFGTGSHPTTKMCLAALESHAAPRKRALDLGCGSGILGIGALLLGCEDCVGCDIDPKAPDVAAANAALNGIGPDRFRVFAGDILSDLSLRRILGGPYDIVLANIVSDVIIPLSAFVGTYLAPEGVFITSGIIDGRENEVAAAIRANGFHITAHHLEEEWHCFECVKE